MYLSYLFKRKTINRFSITFNGELNFYWYLTTDQVNLKNIFCHCCIVFCKDRFFMRLLCKKEQYFTTNPNIYLLT